MGTLMLILEDSDNDLTDLSREMFAEQYEKLVALDEEIKQQDRRISRLCNTRCSSFSIPLPSNSYLHPAEQYFNDAVGPNLSS
ncbi:hypothetical protein [Bathymodiolus japonicus methanotrophic gill symbiont]|uniref:hypothetical protein n=1 Tax=Bathymodiolus japonicus methanotrophic gill symbiont TaxID=113269 RepID=UPI001C8DF649|nr:hypothetical protein [Bathymodiolus japonicus methanotrophic gill symbiont]